MQKTINHTFSFAHAPEIIWAYLTEADLLAEWLMPNDFKPIMGHEFIMKSKPKYKLQFDGTVYCEVLEVVHGEKLVYSWKGGLSKEKPLLDSIVTWMLIPTEHGTDLVLEHSGFKGIKNYLPYFIMNMGWQKIAKRLSKQINIATHGTTTA